MALARRLYAKAMGGVQTHRVVAWLMLALIAGSCQSEQPVYSPTPPPTSSPTPPAWIEEEVTFSFEGDELFGVLTLPGEGELHPAVVLVSGSGGPTGERAGATSRYFIDHSHRFALDGFAVLRYDPPGVGGSGGEIGLPSLERRVEETAAALSYLRSVPAIESDRVGLLGVSQGPWVIAMTAMRYPDDVAFLISVVGSGQSVAQQQVYGIEAQSRAAGLIEPDVAKAVLFGRLLIDWQLSEPMFQEENETDAEVLGDGPWTRLAELVYDLGDINPVERLEVGIEIVKSVQDELWTEALYLRQLYIPRFESITGITPEQLGALQAVADENLRTDPIDFLTQVRTPILAFFGEEDLNVDSERSAALYEEYLSQAGNADFTIVVIPDVGHGIAVSTPGYWNTLSDWLARRFID